MAEFSIFLFGLIFGSFLNMLIYRLSLGISLIDPKRSICTSCKYQLKWYENIPLLSYIFLKARCSNCKTTISIIYPIVELTTALLTLFLYYKLSFSYQLIHLCLIFYILIVLSLIDFKYKAVPEYLLILVLFISFFYSSFSFYDSFVFVGAFVILELFITFYIQNIKAKITKNKALETQKSLGEGDIPIVAIIGGILGLKLGLVAIFFAAFFAIIPALINSIRKKDIETPFIPYLTLGFFIAFVLQTYILEYLWRFSQ